MKCSPPREMKTLLVLLLIAAAVQAKATERSLNSKVTCYSQSYQMGRSREFTNAVHDLGAYSLGNTIASVGGLNGMWIFYDHIDYNSDHYGEVCWTYGINFHGNFPYHCKNMAMSLRYAGSPHDINQDTWTLFAGTHFTSEVVHGDRDISNMDYMSDKASSIILTGPSSWTFYDQYDYLGSAVCLTTNTEHVTEGYEHLDLGIYEWFEGFQYMEDRIRSVRKGCMSQRVIHAPKLEISLRNANGIMGHIKP